MSLTSNKAHFISKEYEADAEYIGIMKRKENALNNTHEGGTTC